MTYGPLDCFGGEFAKYVFLMKVQITNDPYRPKYDEIISFTSVLNLMSFTNISTLQK